MDTTIIYFWVRPEEAYSAMCDGKVYIGFHLEVRKVQEFYATVFWTSSEGLLLLYNRVEEVKGEVDTRKEAKILGESLPYSNLISG